jgi:hypothetical protein
MREVVPNKRPVGVTATPRPHGCEILLVLRVTGPGSRGAARTRPRLPATRPHRLIATALDPFIVITVIVIYPLLPLTTAAARGGRSSLAAAAPASGPALCVRLGVLGQVVGPHEPLVANGAGKSLLTGVRPQVPLQLVGPREPLPTEQPVADKRPLARVPPEVGLQVGRLPVHLPTPGDVARVDVLLA